MMNKDIEKLSFDFPESSKSEWIEKIKSDLNLNSILELKSEINSEFNIEPIYSKEDLKFESVFENQIKGSITSTTNWLSNQKIYIREDGIAESVNLINICLEAGANSIELIPDSNVNIGSVFKDLDLGDCFLILRSSSKDQIDAFRSQFRNINSSQNNLKAVIDFNIGSSIVKNSSLTSENIESILNANTNQISSLCINVFDLKSKGADVVDEISISLGIMNAILRNGNSKLTEPNFIIRLSSESDFFTTLSKIRSTRFLANSLLDLWGIKSKVVIEVSSGIWNKSVFDPNTNILRNTSESFASIAGGCDILSVGGYEDAIGRTTEFSLRNALNISNILKYESHLDKVLDVSAGSYFIENLCEQIANRAWEKFQQIEELGGIEKYINPALLALFSEKAEKQREEFGLKSIKMVGSNVYPNMEDIFSQKNIVTLNNERLSSRIDTLRLEIDSLAESEKPIAYILKLGESEMRFIRAGFISNFIGVSGMIIREIESINQFDGKGILIFCASDEDYLELIENCLNEIKKYKSVTAIAGRPDKEGNLESLGIDFFINIKSPLEETINLILKRINSARA